MYYVTLGNLSECLPDSSSHADYISQPGGELKNTGPFTNVLRSHYWFDKDVEYDTSAAWIFGFAGGRQFTMGKGARYYSWPVHDGDVGVPISTSPASTE